MSDDDLLPTIAVAADVLLAWNVNACVAAVREQLQASGEPYSADDRRAILLVTAAIVWNQGRAALSH
jgi:hypothetical protein